MDVAWHQPDIDTPEDHRHPRLHRSCGAGHRPAAGLGLLGQPLPAHGDNYGVHGNASVGKTAGWAASLRWSDDLGPVLAGLAYDGHGDYLVANTTFTGAAPSPLCAAVPAQHGNPCRHRLAVLADLGRYAVAGSLWRLYHRPLCQRWRHLWRRAALPSGAAAWISRWAHAIPMSRPCKAKLGGETSAGLTFTLGFDGPSLRAISEYGL